METGTEIGSPAAPEGVASAIRLAGSVFGMPRRIRAFFHGIEEHYDLLLPFIGDGFGWGDKPVPIVDPVRLEDHVVRLASSGIDTKAASRSGQLEVRGCEDAHLRGGSFGQDRLLTLADGMRRRSQADGFSRIRFVSQMEWALQDRPGVDRLLEYEARANIVPFEDPVTRAYDLSRFCGAIVVEVMRTHPMVIVGGMSQHDACFVPPGRFLRDLSAKRGGATA